MSKEVSKKAQNTEVAEADLFTGSDSGFEGASSQTFKTPFLKVLQALSPELKKSDPKYSPDAEMGMLFNTATNETMENVEVIVLKVEHSLIIWKPERGGFVGRYPKSMEDEVVTKKDGVQKWDAEGNKVNDTIEFFCADVANPGSIFILSLSTASLKHAKSFATRLRMLRANGVPVNVSWAGVWKISTTEETNEKGSWYTIGSTPEFIRLITKEERDNIVFPAKEMLKNAEADYTVIESVHTEDDKVSY